MLRGCLNQYIYRNVLFFFRKTLTVFSIQISPDICRLVFAESYLHTSGEPDIAVFNYLSIPAGYITLPLRALRQYLFIYLLLNHNKMWKCISVTAKSLWDEYFCPPTVRPCFHVMHYSLGNGRVIIYTRSFCFICTSSLFPKATVTEFCSLIYQLSKSVSSI